MRPSYANTARQPPGRMEGSIGTRRIDGLDHEISETERLGWAPPLGQDPKAPGRWPVTARVGGEAHSYSTTVSSGTGRALVWSAWGGGPGINTGGNIDLC